MTVAIILPDRIVSDSRLYGDPHHTVGKIFRSLDGGLFVTAGDSRLTSLFERAMKEGRQPDPPDARDDEEFDGAVLRPDGRIVVYDRNFSGFLISESWTAIGSGTDVARSWVIHGATPEVAIERVIEVRGDCGPPVVTVLLREQKGTRRGR